VFKTYCHRHADAAITNKEYHELWRRRPLGAVEVASEDEGNRRCSCSICQRLIESASAEELASASARRASAH
jgi:hypothetical protein